MNHILILSPIFFKGVWFMQQSLDFSKTESKF